MTQLQSHCSTLAKQGSSMASNAFRISMLYWLLRRTCRIIVKVLMMAAAVDAFGSCARSAEKVGVRVAGLAKMRL